MRGCGCLVVGLVLFVALAPVLFEGLFFLLLLAAAVVVFMVLRGVFSGSVGPLTPAPPPRPERRADPGAVSSARVERRAAREAAPRLERAAVERRAAPPDSRQRERALDALPQVRELQARLRESLAAAEEAGDARWAFDARACLEEYLPETLRLHAASGRPDSDPEFLEALNDIRVIGVGPLESAQEGRWAAHRHFLAWRAGALREGDAGLTPLPELRLGEREPLPVRSNRDPER